jgi:hypothetical protein
VRLERYTGYPSERGRILLWRGICAKVVLEDESGNGRRVSVGRTGGT